MRPPARAFSLVRLAGLLAACLALRAPIEASELTTLVRSGAARAAATASGAIAPPIAEEQVCITGWFTTVWNGRPRYWITDDQGQRTEIVLDEELARPLGGPLAFDRRRVTVVGELLSDPPGVVRVSSIALADDR